MWLLLVLGLGLRPALTQQLTDSMVHEMELSTFYADCSVYDDCLLFGGPVCGCDGVTYANCVYLSCINHWRPPHLKVKQLHKGPCKVCEPEFPWSPVYLPVCGSNNLTYANREALILFNLNNGLVGVVEVTVQYEGTCVLPCSSCLGVNIITWENAVCATNGRTYVSVEVIADMRRFGQCLDVLHEGGCTVEEVRERIRGRTEVCDLARNFYEYNPVCGSDGISYANPYIMLCYRPNVEVEYMGECDSSMHQACQKAVDIDKYKCVSPGPVCGSDGLTYASVYHLECATNNDKHLTYLHDGPCTLLDSPCVRMPEVCNGGQPVCGSDGITYINSYALWCMQRKEDPFLRYFHDGPCFRRCVECSCSVACSPCAACC